jgi:hypothetical protein
MMRLKSDRENEGSVISNDNQQRINTRWRHRGHAPDRAVKEGLRDWPEIVT